MKDPTGSFDCGSLSLPDMETIMRKSALGLVWVLFLLAANGDPQEFRATLTGRVTGAQNLTVAEAAGRVRNADTSEGSSAKTESHANFSCHFLRPGSYTITVSNS